MIGQLLDGRFPPVWTLSGAELYFAREGLEWAVRYTRNTTLSYPELPS